MSGAWTETTLGEIAKVVSGATPKTSIGEYWDGGIPWVTPKDLSELEDSEISTTPRTISEAGLRSCGASLLPSDSVLLSSRAPIGHVAINTVPMATNQGFKSLVPDPLLVIPKFLYWWLDRNRARIQAMGNGATFKEISKKITESIAISLPPIEEQRRITSILDAAAALRAKRRAALARLDTLTQAVFIDMFGDPLTNPLGWPQKKLGTLASKFSDGPFGSNLKSDHYVDSGVRVVRLQNIGVGEFIDDDTAYISMKHFSELKKHECLPGDVLVGTMGDPNLRACIQPDSLAVALNKADCVQIRVDEALASRDWLCTLLNCQATETKARSLVRGQTRARISMGRLRDLEVPVPPLSEQLEFAKRAGEVQSRSSRMRSSREHFDHLFVSLQQRAFRGQL